jgi:hypothetical protein
MKLLGKAAISLLDVISRGTAFDADCTALDQNEAALASSIFGPRADRLTVHLIEAFETSWFATRKPEGNRFNVVVRLADQPDWSLRQTQTLHPEPS